MPHENEVRTVDAVSESNTFVPTGNPLEYLTEAQVAAIAKRFNKSWRKPRETAIEELQNLYSMDAFTAMFTVALIEDANTRISNEKVNETADLIATQAQAILRGSTATVSEALRSIKNAYEVLAPTQRGEAGKKIRKQVFAANTTRDFRKIMDAVLETLEVRESEWM